MISACQNFFNRLSTRSYFWALSALLILFCLRVLGQLIVATYGVDFLPPMEEWFSGILPYPALLCCQLLIIAVYGRVCFEFARQDGFFVIPKRQFGSNLINFSLIYLLVMILRYVIRMSLYPAERWTGGSIPIFFHLVLALFLLLLGLFHYCRASLTSCSISERRSEEIDYILKNKSIIPSFSKALIKPVLNLAAILFILLWAGWQVLPSALAFRYGVRPPVYAVRKQNDTKVVTSDGVALSTEIYHPLHVLRTPTILVRIPLTKSLRNLFWADVAARVWAERGYTVVIQGTRGRFGSGGTFYPLKGESADGRATLRWLRAQTWFNGRLAMWGGSSFGYTQWSIADDLESGNSCLDIYESTTDFRKMFYPGGAFSLFSALSWAINSAGTSDLPGWPSTLEVCRAASTLPPIDADVQATGKKITFFRDWMNHTQDDAYWRSLDESSSITNLKVPALLVAGWYDPFLPAQLDDFKGLRQSTQPGVAVESRLVIGPWVHAGELNTLIVKKSQPFRPESFFPSVAWFDQNLKPPGIALQHSFSAPVRIFVMGNNVWRDEQEWPLARTQYTPFYLFSDGHANGVRNQGSLMRVGSMAERFLISSDVATTGTEPSLNGSGGTLQMCRPSDGLSFDSFTYDPYNPVPTEGGPMLGSAPAIASQEMVEKRSDVLNYTTGTLEQDIEVTGPVSLILYVATSAPSTDFTAKLVDVSDELPPLNVCDGILRQTYSCKGAERSALGDSIEVHLIKIELCPTSFVFAKGHKIRLEVSSSNFPRFDRNTNSESSIPLATAFVKARQKIFHDRNYPSTLILPIIPSNESSPIHL
jgi:predicted acyl esterase